MTLPPPVTAAIADDACESLSFSPLLSIKMTFFLGIISMGEWSALMAIVDRG
jgi:hypothetical protein